jgi:hypothetical protein
LGQTQPLLEPCSCQDVQDIAGSHRDVDLPARRLIGPELCQDGLQGGHPAGVGLNEVAEVQGRRGQAIGTLGSDGRAQGSLIASPENPADLQHSRAPVSKEDHAPSLASRISTGQTPT